MKQTCKISLLALIALSCSQMFLVEAYADCDDNIKRSTPTADFEFLVRGSVVLHKKTGLEWQRCPEGMLFIEDSSAYHSHDACGGTASTFNLNGVEILQTKVNSDEGRNNKKDWRLPTIDELASIVEDACQLPAINTVVFPDTPVTWFWAISPKELSTGLGKVWGIGFGAGGYYVGRNDFGAVRLVRGARK